MGLMVLQSPACEAMNPDELAKPQACHAAGLDCDSCVRQSAGNLLQVCHPLTAEQAQAFFFGFYPDPACVPMARRFTQIYLRLQKEVESAIA